MGDIEKYIKNKAYRVYDKNTELIPSENGIINQDVLDIHALGSIQRATMSLDSFVDIKPEYPEETHTEVEFNTDLMVIKSSHYKELIKMISKLEHSTYRLDEVLKSVDEYFKDVNNGDN